MLLVSAPVLASQDPRLVLENNDAARSLQLWSKYQQREQEIEQFQKAQQQGQADPTESPPEPIAFNRSEADRILPLLTEALVRDPFNPTLHFNLSQYYLRTEDPDRAQKAAAYARRLAIEQGEPLIIFNSEVLLGNIAADAGQVDTALKHYQAALDLKVFDRLVQHNIEALWQQGGGGGEGQQGGGQGEPSSEGETPDQDPKMENGKQQEKLQQQADSPYVRRLLEEIESQELEILGKEYDKNSKQRSKLKDW